MSGTSTQVPSGTHAGGRGRTPGSGREPATVLIADTVSESGLRPLLDDDRFRVEMGSGWQTSDPERFAGALAEARALIVRSATTVDRSLLERAPNLEVVGRAGVGVDNIDMDAATERGIAVLNAPAGNTVSAAELTCALILSLVRRVPSADRAVRAGEWKRARFGGQELRGKTLALVGAGRIGGEVARRMQAFGMKVVAHDPYLSEERARDLEIERVELAEVLARGDVVSLHVPLTEQTRGMIGEEQLRAMKDTAMLVNVARGGVVDEDALARGLTDGVIAGAALDVFEEEPLGAGSPLRDAPNLVLTPHLGASTTEAQELVAVEISEAVRAALLDGDLSRALNAPAIGGEALRRLRPLLELGRRLGRLGCSLAPGGIQGVEVRYHGTSGDASKPLTSYVLMGLLGTIVGDDQVNFVNAGYLADVRGIGVSTHRLARRTDYTEFVEVIVRAEGGDARLAGALLEDQYPRIVRVDDYHVDVTPRGSLLLLRNRDVPGVIGKVGTLLGSMGVNIAEYHQARLSEGGEALAAVALDGRVDRSLAQALLELPEVVGAWIVDLR